MRIRKNGREYECPKLRDQYTVVYYDKKNKRYTGSTWDVEIYCNSLESWLPFEKAYGEVVFCKPGTYELYEQTVEI